MYKPEQQEEGSDQLVFGRLETFTNCHVTLIKNYSFEKKQICKMLPPSADNRVDFLIKAEL